MFRTVSDQVSLWEAVLPRPVATACTTQRRVVEAAGVEVEDTGRLGAEVGVAGEDPAPVLPGLDRIRTQPAPDRGARDRGDDAGLDGGAGQVGARVRTI